MRSIRITSKDSLFFDEAMELYKTSFPKFEQRKIEHHLEALEHEDYNCTIICENNKLVGLLFYWETDKYRYIEHFAIHRGLRGQNYGSKILKEFCTDDKTLLLEIDPPEDHISKKRLSFYSKLGFRMQDFDHFQPSYREGHEGNKLKILSFNKDMTDKEYDEFNRYFNQTVMQYTD